MAEEVVNLNTGADAEVDRKKLKEGIIDKDFIGHAKVAQLVARRIRNA